MNCFSMMPNYYANAAYQTPLAVAMPPCNENATFANIAVLKTLSQALNKSLQNYEQKQVQISEKSVRMQQ